MKWPYIRLVYTTSMSKMKLTARENSRGQKVWTDPFDVTT